VSAKTPRLTATERLRRMLAIVPWVAAQPDGATIDEICARFDLDRAQLLESLDTAFMVGLHPYTPDALIDVLIEEDRVQIRLPDFFTRPLRLTAEETLALLVAGRSLANLEGDDVDGPLVRGLRKLSATVGTDRAVDVELGQAAGALVPVIQGAVADRRRVALDYYSYGRDELTHRRIDPWRLHAEQGAWYLEAWCHSTGDVRVFRLDRVADLEVLEEHFEPPDEPVGRSIFTPAADDPRVRLDLAAEARWVAEQYPVEELEELDGGAIRVTLAVTARPWLERLLLRLGPAATVVDAPDTLVGVRRDAARRILQRYDG
jgi:proteasome accessory factor C